MIVVVPFPAVVSAFVTHSASFSQGFPTPTQPVFSGLLELGLASVLLHGPALGGPFGFDLAFITDPLAITQGLRLKNIFVMRK